MSHKQLNRRGVQEIQSGIRNRSSWISGFKKTEGLDVSFVEESPFPRQEMNTLGTTFQDLLEIQEKKTNEVLIEISLVKDSPEAVPHVVHQQKVEPDLSIHIIKENLMKHFPGAKSIRIRNVKVRGMKEVDVYIGQHASSTNRVIEFIWHLSKHGLLHKYGQMPVLHIEVKV